MSPRLKSRVLLRWVTWGLLLSSSVACETARREVFGGETATDPKKAKTEYLLSQPSLEASSVSAEATTLDPGASTPVSVTAVRADGEPFTSGGLKIGFRHSGGTATGTFGPVVDNGDGTYTSNFVAVRSGSATKIIAYIEDLGVFSTQPQIAVNFLSAPSALSYDDASPDYAIGQAIEENTPTVTGVVESYSVDPALPTGLILNSTTGVISGVPLAMGGPTVHTVTATNPLGNTTTDVTITILPPGPSGLSYSAPAPSYPRNRAITNNTPTVTGDVTDWAISPALPSGLSFNTSTGVISGTVAVGAALGTTEHTVTASNSGGSTQTVLSITIAREPPTTITYNTYPSGTALAFPRSAAMTTLTPTVTANGGGFSWTVSPALPTGVTLNATTGVISGTPTVVQSETAHTITVTNDGGSASYILKLAINPSPPTNLSYSAMNPSYERLVAIANNTPTVSGDPVTSYSITPALPMGLSLNTTTGVISGTPQVVVDPAEPYTITATNAGGSTSAVVNIRINPRRPLSLSYSPGTVKITRLADFTSATPTKGGDAVDLWTVSPALPDGLTLNSATGIITGAPTTQQGQTTHKITATNNGGSATYNYRITVNHIAPSGLTYDDEAPTYTRGVAIAANNPTLAGGDAPTTYSVIAGSLPAGLSLNSTTGVISGTPTVSGGPTAVTIRAQNTGGNTTRALSITVIPQAPVGLGYTTSPAVYSKNVLITNNTPTVTGGDLPTSFVITSGTLPTGLSLNASTGVISGTPTTVQDPADVTIQGTNASGTDSVTVSFRVWGNEKSTEFTKASSHYATTAAMSSILSNAITTFSVQAWVKALSSSANDGILSAAPSGRASGLGLYWWSANVIRFFVDGDANGVNSGVIGSPGNWNHVVASYDSGAGASNIRIYINGSLSSANYTGTISNLNNVLSFGRQDDGGSYGDLRLDEIGVWNTALPSTAVTALYNSGTPINLQQNKGNYTQTGTLRAYWRMGDGDTAPTLVDNGTNGFDGTIHNGAGLSVDAP